MRYPETMKALVAYGKGDYRLERNYPVPPCGDDDILIKTDACGICASDVKCLHGAESYWGNETAEGWAKPPFIPGHEFLGHVVYVGGNVTDFKVGDRVTPEQIAPCGECRFCKRGQYWMCNPHKMYGYFNDFCGGMAEYVRLRVKHSQIHKVPEDMELKSAILIEPYGCAKHCVDRAQIGSEDVVVLAGAGTLGLGMTTYAASRNPAQLIVLDMIDSRLEKAKEFGADIVMNPGKEDVVAKVLEMTGGYGCDIYIEATGAPASVRQGMQMIRKLGRFVEFSVFGQETSLDWSIIGDKKELDVLGAHISPYCYPYVIEHMYDGRMKTDGVVTGLYSLDDWETAFEKASGKYGDLKVAFTFD